MCIFLFKLQKADVFWNVYPLWLFGLNGLFMAGSIGTLACNWRRVYKAAGNPANSPSGSASALITAHLWIICPLTLLSVMQALVVWVGISGHGFK